jgi:hypothetical protein
MYMYICVYVYHESIRAHIIENKKKLYLVTEFDCVKKNDSIPSTYTDGPNQNSHEQRKNMNA